MEPENNSSGKKNDDFISPDYMSEMDKMIRALTLRAMDAGNDNDFDTAYLNMDVALWMQSMNIPENKDNDDEQR